MRDELRRLIAQLAPWFELRRLRAEPAPRVELRIVFPARMPRFELRTLLPTRMPRFELGTLLPGRMPSFALGALLPASMPSFALGTLLPARMPGSKLVASISQRERVALLAGVLAGAALTATVGIVIARRRRSRPGGEPVRGAPMRRLRGFVIRAWNPMVLRFGLAGGRRSPWGLIEHVGRHSGHLFRTPISLRAIEGGYELPLPYGTDVDWVMNVLAAGQARIQFHDTIIELDQPEIVEAQDARSIPEAMRAPAQRAGYRYLRLRTVAEMPGDFAHGDGHQAPLTRGEPFPMPAEGSFDATFLAPAGVAVPVEPRMVEGTPAD